MRDDDEAARAYTGTWCAHGDIGYASPGRRETP